MPRAPIDCGHISNCTAGKEIAADTIDPPNGIAVSPRGPTARNAALYPVYDISDARSQRSETLGSKAKYWIEPAAGCGLASRPHLFKIGRENTGENWSEKVAAEIAGRIGLPHAKYEFATDSGVKGVVSETFVPARGGFFPANLFLGKISTTPGSTVRQLRQREYDALLALRLVRSLALSAPIGADPSLSHLTPLGFFSGYLLFDALIGNTDRHEENWGVVVAPGVNQGGTGAHLAPSFDHASSLGRNESDANRLRRLSIVSGNGSVEAYAARAKSALLKPDGQRMAMREVVTLVQEVDQAAVTFWAERIVRLTSSDFRSVLDEVGGDWISEPARQFALRLLLHNQRMVREICLVQ